MVSIYIYACFSLLIHACAVCGGIHGGGEISNQSASKAACLLCKNLSELDTVMHNPYSKILLMARCTEILANLGP